MTAVFADTFYWIALADRADSAHQRALALTAERADSPIITTDEVLTEYLTFFATAPEPFRRAAAEGVERIMGSSCIRVIAQSRDSFLTGLRLYRARPDRLQLDRLHFDANNAAGGPDGSADERPAF
jgi:predicted nucleic acid-binding protein